VVGGAGSFIGAVVGSFILVPLSELMREFGSLRVVLYSIMLLVFTIGLPEGIFRFVVRKYTQFERFVRLEEPSAPGTHGDASSPKAPAGTGGHVSGA